MGYYIIEYEDGGSIPTIELGSGDVRIGATRNDAEKKAGVAFCEIEAGEIGRDVDTPPGSTVTSLGSVFQIESSSIASLLVLRDDIDKAIGYLEEMQSD